MVTEITSGVGVIGSCRKKEKTRTYCREDDFPFICEKIGELLAKNNYQLVIGWSNDFMPDQVCSDDKYHFENTADYHALRGYLSKQSTRTHSVKPIIYLSKLNFEIFEIVVKLYKHKNQIPLNKWNSLINEFKDKDDKTLAVTKSLRGILSDEDIECIIGLRENQQHNYDGLTYLSYLIKSDIQLLSQIVEGKKYATVHVNKRLDNQLRSHITRYEILSKIKLLFTIGGGKVTGNALEYAIDKQLPLIPILSFGGETDELFTKKLESFIEEFRNKDTREQYKSKLREYKPVVYTKESWKTGHAQEAIIKRIEEFQKAESPTRLPVETDGKEIEIKGYIAKLLDQEFCKFKDDIKERFDESDNRIISRIDISEKRIIEYFTSQLNKTDREIVKDIIGAFESNTLNPVDRKEIEDIVNQACKVLKEMPLNSVEYPAEIKDTIRKLIESQKNVENNIEHRLVLTVYLIPGLLRYEAHTTVRKLWNELTAVWERIPEKLSK